jgi:hypothetical protein
VSGIERKKCLRMQAFSRDRCRLRRLFPCYSMRPLRMTSLFRNGGLTCWRTQLRMLSGFVHSSRVFFPRALAQLGSVEAQLLDFMNDHAVGGATNGIFDPAKELDRHHFSVIHAEYRKLVKSTVPPYSKASIDELGETLAALNVLIAHGMVRTENPYGTAPNLCSYRMTSLGLEFVSVCRQPKKAQAE